MNHSAQLRKVARKSNFKALSDKISGAPSIFDMDCGQNEAAMAAYACCRIQSNCKLANQDGSKWFPCF